MWGLSKIPDIARGNNLFFLKPGVALGLSYFILEDNITKNKLLAIIAITGFIIIKVFIRHFPKLLKKRNYNYSDFSNV